MGIRQLKQGWIVLGILVVVLLGNGCKKEYVHVGSNWDAINKLQKPENTFSVQVAGTGSVKVGEPLRYTVTSEKNGKLLVVQVDPKDEVSMLFPNSKARDNSIQANNPLTVPPADDSWSIVADEPKGESIVVFVVTTGDTDIDDVINNEKSMKKAIRVVEKAESWGFSKKVVEVR